MQYAQHCSNGARTDMGKHGGPTWGAEQAQEKAPGSGDIRTGKDVT